MSTPYSNRQENGSSDALFSEAAVVDRRSKNFRVRATRSIGYTGPSGVARSAGDTGQIDAGNEKRAQSSQLDMFLDPPDPNYLDPQVLLPSPSLIEASVSGSFIRSVRRLGVVTPVLVAREADGTWRLVAGRRRVMAAAETGRMVPIRIVTGTDAELEILAFNEDRHRRNRSYLERAWQVERITAAARADGVTVSRRWLSTRLAVAVGTAQNLMMLSERLPQGRVVRLAEAAGVEARQIVALSFDKAEQVAQAADDAEAATLLQRLLIDDDVPRERSKIWTCLRALILAVAESLRREASRITSYITGKDEPPI